MVSSNRGTGKIKEQNLTLTFVALKMKWGPDLCLSHFETNQLVYTVNMSRSSKKKSQNIIIDESRGLVFNSEQELYAHFASEIDTLEKEFFNLRQADDDVSEAEFAQYDPQLEDLLDDPDEVWEDSETVNGQRIFIYLRRFENEISHIAACYLTESTPSFVYLHFPTRNEALLEKYRRGQMVFQRAHADAPAGAIDGDALHEGDELAMGLYKAMLMLRSDKDIPEEQFHDHAERREISLEEADEIWRSDDSQGNVLVSFIKEFGEEEDEVFYVVVTVEDAPSGSHALLFSFPTRDKGLVDRYRHGENLQAEEVVQESSH